VPFEGIDGVEHAAQGVVDLVGDAAESRPTAASRSLAMIPVPVVPFP
jgi:hypothetical protein